MDISSFSTTNWAILIGMASVLLLGLIAIFLYARRGKKAIPPPVVELPSERKSIPIPTAAPEPERVPVSEPRPERRPRESRLTDGLSRTRGSLLGKLGQMFGRSASAIPPAEWEQLEEALLEGDVGIHTVNLLLEKIRARLKAGNTEDIRQLIQQESEALMSGLPHGKPDLSSAPKPYVISVVGVNGAGKTTTIGKLAQLFKDQGKTVLIGAGDTFRAAAIGQLKVWADRAQAQFVTGREGGDPGAVAFDAVSAGKAREVDVVILDTAGRLHTKSNLMDELKKVQRVMKKVIPEAPHETWLVLDGTTGQNAIRQAQEFQKALDLTGVVITKLDGTAKGGALIAIAAELKLPIKFIGVGESIEDLVSFEPRPFIEAILGGPASA